MTRIGFVASYRPTSYPSPDRPGWGLPSIGIQLSMRELYDGIVFDASSAGEWLAKKGLTVR
jgi:hypothetical protein